MLRGGSFRAGRDDILPVARSNYDAPVRYHAQRLPRGPQPGLSRPRCCRAAATTAGGGRPDVDGDALRHHRRIVRHVVLIAHEQLQRVDARRQFEHRLGLAESEMQVVAVVRDRLIERRQRRIDQQVVVAGVRLGDAGRRDAEIAGAEPDLEAAGADQPRPSCGQPI